MIVFFIKASAEGDAGVSHVLADKKFSNDNDTGLIGTIPSKVAAVYTLGTTNQIIASGQYLSEIQTILGDANLISTNIISGKSIFGVSGSASVTSLGGKQFASESTLASSLTLTYPCIGGTSFAGYEIVISGLTFTPRYIIAKAISAESEYVTIYDEILFKTKKTASMYYLNSSSGKATISVFAANRSSYEGGFKITVEQNTNDYEWYAFG